MTKITPDFLQKFEFYSIFLNNLFVFLGVWLLDWSLFASVFLVWLELLAAMLVLNYLVVVVPVRYGRPGVRYLEEYRRPAFKVILLSIYTLVFHYMALIFLIELGDVGSWDTSQGILMTLVQMPVELWREGYPPRRGGFCPGVVWVWVGMHSTSSQVRGSHAFLNRLSPSQSAGSGLLDFAVAHSDQIEDAIEPEIRDDLLG